MGKELQNLYNPSQAWAVGRRQRDARRHIIPFNTGFTLSELLIAALLALIVLGVSGWGVISVLGASKVSNSQSVRRMEMERSLEFISTEIQQAIKINEGTPSFVPGTPLNSEVDQTSIQIVFQLTIPNQTQPIIYYIAKPLQRNRPWVGPNVVYRWGPLMDGTGTYTTTWSHLPLIDSLEDSAAPFDVTNSLNCPQPVGTSRWVATPLSSPATGFYGCVDPTNRIAQIFHRGRVYKAFGGTEPYFAQKQAFARAATVGGATTSTIIVPVSTGRTQVPQESQVTLRILGSDIRCGAGGSPTFTRLLVSISQPNGIQQSQTFTISPNPVAYDLPEVTLQAGGSISYTGLVPPQNDNNPNNICNMEAISNGVGFNSDTNSRQVRVLKHGDPVPTVAGFGASLSAKDIISGYVLNGKINLPDPQRQAIILFELGTTDTSRQAFDLQDIAILAIANPVP